MNEKYGPLYIQRCYNKHFIPQRYDYDCGVASIAMYCRVSYEEALKVTLEVAGEKHDFKLQGIAVYQVLEICDKLGEPSIVVIQDGCFKAILYVPSLNTEHGTHYVCKFGSNEFNRFVILDPQHYNSEKKSYKKVESYEMINIIAPASDLNVRHQFNFMKQYIDKAQGKWKK